MLEEESSPKTISGNFSDLSSVFCLLVSLNTVGDSNLGSFTKNLSRETCFCLCFKMFLTCDIVRYAGAHFGLLELCLGGTFPQSFELQPTYCIFLYQCLDASSLPSFSPEEMCSVTMLPLLLKFLQLLSAELCSVLLR